MGVSRTSWWWSAVAVAATVATLALYLSGHGVIPLVVAATAPWIVVAAKKWGWALALVTVMALGLLALLAVAFVSSALATPLGAAYGGALAAAGLAGWVALRGTAAPGPSLAMTRRRWWVIAPGAAWIVLAVGSAVLQGGSNRSWAMEGDSSNNILFARDIVKAHGLALDAGNPVPLAHAVLSLGMAAGRSGASRAELVDLDTFSYASTWQLALVANVVLLAVLGFAVARRAAGASTAAIAAATLVAGALPFTWAYTTIAMDFGFFNMHLSLALVVGAMIAGIEAHRAPTVSVAVQVVLSLLLMATWTPLALVPLAVAVTTVPALRARGLTRRRLAWIAAAAGAWLAFALGITLPRMAPGSGTFSAGGGVAVLPRVVIAGIAVLGCGLVLLAYRRGLRSEALVLGAAVCSLGVALVALFVLAGFAWTYYPQKMSWIVVLVCVAVGVIVTPAIGWGSPSRVLRLASVSAGALLFVGVSLAPTVLARMHHSSAWVYAPWVRIIGGDGIPGGLELYSSTSALVASDDIRVSWGVTGDGEADANFWALNLYADHFDDTNDHARRDAVRILAYGFYAPSVDVLCAIPDATGAHLIVMTEDPAVAVHLADQCPSEDIAVVEPSAGS